jgi:hypothetical protein
MKLTDFFNCQSLLIVTLLGATMALTFLKTRSVILIKEPCVDHVEFAVFIKSYRGDIQWLQYTIPSVAKHLKLPHRLVISVPETDYKAFKHFFPDTHVLVHDDYPITYHPLFDMKSKGYVEQMVVKLWADNFTNSDYIMFVDSDTPLCEDLYLEEIFNQGMIMNAYRNWSGDPHEHIWRPRVEFMLRINNSYDTMAGQSYVYKSETMKRMRDHLKSIHGNLFNFFSTFANNISEFEFMGNFALRHEKGYLWSQNLMRRSKFHQKWSWGGFNDQILEDLTKCSGADPSSFLTKDNILKVLSKLNM